jgi:predicted esterase
MMRRPLPSSSALGIALLLAVLFPAGSGWAQPPEPAQAAPPAQANGGETAPVACPPGVAERLCEPWPRGEIVDPVECRADPAKSYALYLPSSYTPDRLWPSLVVLDARGRGRHAAEVFRAAAERFGWLVLSSNDSASDSTWDKISEPVAAILADAPQRFAIDPRRIYLAGFSGTAHGVGVIAYEAGGRFPGAFLAGGGLPEALPVAEVPYAMFAAAGSKDFNFREIDPLADPLAAAGVPHRVEIFDGVHEWPPAELAAEALAFFELRAMVDGTRRFLPEVAAELAAGWLEEAAGRERDGDTVGAYRLYRAAAADLDALVAAAGSVPVAAADRLRALRTEAASASGRLGASVELRRALAERRRAADWEEERRRELERQLVLPLLRIEETLPLDLPTRGARLIAKLQAEAARDGARALAARRVLGLAAAHTGFYIPRDLLPRGEYRRVEIALEMAVLVREDNAAAWYNLACARARLERATDALDALERAIAAGYRDAEHMAADPDLESLRGDDRFAALVARARETGG